MNTTIFENKNATIVHSDTINFIVWRQENWGPIPIHGKGEKQWNINKRIEYNKNIQDKLEKNISTAEGEKKDKLKSSHTIVSERIKELETIKDKQKTTEKPKESEPIKPSTKLIPEVVESMIAKGKTNVRGMNGDFDLYHHSGTGVNIKFQRGEYTEIDIKGISNSLDKLPGGAKAALSKQGASLVITRKRGKHPVWEEHSGAIALYRASDKTAIILGGPIRGKISPFNEASAYHELGHALYDSISPSLRTSWMKIHMSARKGEAGSFVNDIANINAKEDFAETFAYWSQSKLLKRKNVHIKNRTQLYEQEFGKIGESK